MMNGIVLLHSSESGYYGVLCRSCRKITLKKSEIGFVKYLKEDILHIDPANVRAKLFMRYDSFPYTFKTNEFQKSETSAPIQLEADWESAIDNAFEQLESDDDRISYSSYFLGDPITGYMKSTSNVGETGIRKRIEIENAHGFKQFPRYAYYHSSIDRVQRFCWKKYQNFELMSQNKSAVDVEDNLLNRPDNKIKLCFHFMELLEEAQYVDFADLIVAEISSKPIPEFDYNYFYEQI